MSSANKFTFQDVCDYTTEVFKRISSDSIALLNRKRLYPTSSPQLNEILHGGISSQQIVEFVGKDYMLIGEIFTTLALDHLYRNPQTEAIFITTSGSHNESQMLASCRHYLSKVSNLEDESISEMCDSILARIYIIKCLSCSDFYEVVEDIIEREGKLKGGDDVEVDGGVTAAARRLGMVFVHLVSNLAYEGSRYGRRRNIYFITKKLRSTAVSLNCAVLISNCEDVESVSMMKEDEVSDLVKGVKAYTYYVDSKVEVKFIKGMTDKRLIFEATGGGITHVVDMTYETKESIKEVHYLAGQSGSI